MATLFDQGIFFSAGRALFLGSLLVVCPVVASAQRHGGGHGVGGGIPGGSERPTGVDEKDGLKDFRRALAAQASSPQIAEFQTLVKSIEAAQRALHSFLQPVSVENGSASPDSRASLDDALETARNGNKKFQEGFSAAQKSELRDMAKRLSKSDAALEQEKRRLDQSVDANTPRPEILASGENVDKALADFHDQELALGREMSIVLATGQDLAFILPQVKNQIGIQGRPVAVTISGGLSQIAAQSSERTFKLELLADVSDLQQNFTELLRAQLDATPICGQRIAIRQATISPSTPASLLVVQLHFERWTCTRMNGQQSASELGEGDGTVEIKLTPTIDPPNTLKITAALGRIDATGMMGEALRSGELGENLGDEAAKLLLLAARAGSDFKVALPPAVQNSATFQSARFQDENVGGLSLVLEGQAELSNEQTSQLAIQLNQALSAQAAPSPEPSSGTVPQLTKRPQ